MTDTTTTPTTASTERIPSADGTTLLLRSWLPAASPRGILTIVHGFNSHSGYYLWAGPRFAAAGFAVYALDLRGRGESDGERYFIESFDDYLADVHAAVGVARSRHPGLPLFVLGHSAGGVIATSYVLAHQSDCAGLVCESFAFKVFAPDIALSLVKGLSHVLPHTHILRLPIDEFSRDPAVIAQMKADPFVRDEVQAIQTVAEMARADDRLAEAFPRIVLPVLILHGTADKVTRPAGSEQFHRDAGSTDKTLKLYDGHAHDLLSDVGKDAVMADIVGWLHARLPAA